jgi:hypothetical protein
LQDAVVAYFPSARSKIKRPKLIKAPSSNIKFSYLDHMLSTSWAIKNSVDSASEIKDNYQVRFENMQSFLRILMNVPQLKLVEDLHTFNYYIHLPNKEPFELRKLSEGYASVLNIYMGLALRSITEKGLINNEMTAIALVDELESHLHVTAQKNILPILSRIFPNTQFIISTYSPLVITSEENAVTYDLGKKEVLENLSPYSYNTILQTYFGSNAYSYALARYLERYKELALKKRNEKESFEFKKILDELELMSPSNLELYFEFTEFEEERLEL